MDFTVEECFYLTVPFLLAGLSRRRELRLVGYAVALIGLGCLLASLPAPLHPYGFFGSWGFLFRFTFFGRCIKFLSGIYLALFLFKRFEETSNQWTVITLAGISWIVICWELLTWVYVLGPRSQATIF